MRTIAVLTAGAGAVAAFVYGVRFCAKVWFLLFSGVPGEMGHFVQFAGFLLLSATPLVGLVVLLWAAGAAFVVVDNILDPLHERF